MQSPSYDDSVRRGHVARHRQTSISTPKRSDAFCAGTNSTASCTSPEEAARPSQLIDGDGGDCVQHVPLPANRVNIQPPNGRTLVNFDTNFYTDSAPLTRTVTLLGRRVTLHITPASWTWTFGDGTTTTTTTPGAAYPALDITHTYQRQGHVDPSVATTYTATYTVDGGPARPVPGTVTIPGPSTPLQVVTARPQLNAAG